MPAKFSTFHFSSGANKRKFYYSKKNYVNPFFRQRPKNFSLTRAVPSAGRLKLASSLLAVIFIVGVWLIFFSNTFKITKIEISGVDQLMAAEVEKEAMALADGRLIGKNNLVFFSKNQLSAKLNEQYYLDSLAVTKSWPRTLKISLTQKQQAAFWQERDKYYNLDASGKIITQIDPLNINRGDFPLIDNQTGVDLVGRQANINEATVSYTLKLFYEFKDKKHGFEIENFIIDTDVNTVKLAVLGGPKIYFNTKADPGEQAAKLDLIIKDKLKDDFLKKTYLDLRFGNNVYIK